MRIGQPRARRDLPAGRLRRGSRPCAPTHQFVLAARGGRPSPWRCSGSSSERGLLRFVSAASRSPSCCSRWGVAFIVGRTLSLAVFGGDPGVGANARRPRRVEPARARSPTPKPALLHPGGWRSPWRCLLYLVIGRNTEPGAMIRRRGSTTARWWTRFGIPIKRVFTAVFVLGGVPGRPDGRPRREPADASTRAPTPRS